MADWSPLISLIQLIFLVLVLIPMGNIIKRAGYNPWLVLLGIVPVVNIVMFLVFAFSAWPRLRASSATAETFE